jgi:hypothetical protein
VTRLAPLAAIAFHIRHELRRIRRAPETHVGDTHTASGLRRDDTRFYGWRAGAVSIAQVAVDGTPNFSRS